MTADKGRSGLGRLGSFSASFKEQRKETVRQVFLFTNHLLLTTRSSNGRLHLAKVSSSMVSPLFGFVLPGSVLPGSIVLLGSVLCLGSVLLPGSVLPGLTVLCLGSVFLPG